MSECTASEHKLHHAQESTLRYARCPTKTPTTFVQVECSSETCVFMGNKGIDIHQTTRRLAAVHVKISPKDPQSGNTPP